MTPKEKAKELYDKMLQWQDTADIYIERNITSNSAKHSALIAVDELIEAVRYLDDDSQYFYEEVKHEIEQL